MFTNVIIGILNKHLQIPVHMYKFDTVLQICKCVKKIIIIKVQTHTHKHTDFDTHTQISTQTERQKKINITTAVMVN